MRQVDMPHEPRQKSKRANWVRIIIIIVGLLLIASSVALNILNRLQGSIALTVLALVVALLQWLFPVSFNSSHHPEISSSSQSLQPPPMTQAQKFSATPLQMDLEPQHDIGRKTNTTTRSPRTLWNVPFRRNPFFTGREELLALLHRSLVDRRTAALTQPQVISGLGGIGKTQVAVEYAYRYRDEYRFVLWVRAAAHETIISDFVALAHLLHLPEKDDQDQNLVVAALKRWFTQHKGWLLILDNADDLVQVYDFLPINGLGHVLLTTRSHAVGSLGHLIEVDKMTTEEGVLLLLRRAKLLESEVSLDQATKEDQIQAEAIVLEMDGLPLALDQAGAYIEEMRCSLSSYFDLYHIHRKDLLQRRGKFSTDHPESVTTTWSLSFQRVEQINPAASDLLRLCAFLDPDAIPEEIITEGVLEPSSFLSLLAADPLKLNEAIEVLLHFSLIRRNPNTTMLTVHRLVQAVIKEVMNDETQCQWAERTVRIVNRIFPDVVYETWIRCQRYLPHAQACELLIEQYRFFFPEAGRLLNQAGSYLYFHAQYADAEPLLKQALTIREQVLGSKHPDMVISLNNLALLYRAQSKYAEAELLLRHVLENQEQESGRWEPGMIQSLIDLAFLCQIQSRYEEAEQLMKRALDISEQVLGPQHFLTVRSLNYVAGLYRIQGKYEEAEQLMKRVVAIREQTLGPEHPDTGGALNSLGLLYNIWGKYTDAEPLLKRALLIREQVLGPLHPYTAISLNILGEVYQAEGRYEEAEQLMSRALAIREHVLGPEHPYTAISLNTLGAVYQAEGRYEEAEQLMSRAITIDEKVMGPMHPETGQILNNLADLYCAQGEYQHAELLYQRALTIYEHSLGSEHPQCAAIQKKYINVVMQVERKQKELH